MIDDENASADDVESAPAPVAAPAKEETDSETTPPEEGAKAEADGKEPEAKPDDDAAKASEAAKTLNERKRSAQERINEAVGRQRRAERERDEARQYVAELLKKLNPPDPSKYDDVSKLTADQVSHTFDVREAERMDRRADAAAIEAERAMAEAWIERVNDFKAENADFEEVAYRAPITDGTARLVAELEDGPAIAYWLGKNPSEARRIDRMPERAKMIEMGRISARISQPPPRRTTQAPEPVRAVGGSNSGRSDFDPNKASMEEYIAKRKAGWKG